MLVLMQGAVEGVESYFGRSCFLFEGFFRLFFSFSNRDFGLRRFFYFVFFKEVLASLFWHAVFGLDLKILRFLG